jgi:hypothetical protein
MQVFFSFENRKRLPKLNVPAAEEEAGSSLRSE